MFWRGDATNTQDFRNAFANFQGTFNNVFPGLLGNDAPLAQADFDALSLWAITLVPPPNPHRNLDNSLTRDQQIGQNLFTNRVTDTIFPCVGCHKLDPSRAFFGTGGEMTIEGETQEFKVTQLATVYDKVGMFGATVGLPRTGPQIRGSGTLHDGSLGGPEQFVDLGPFQPLNAVEIGQIGDFLFAFPNEYAPIVGQQVTLRPDSPQAVDQRIDLMRARASAPFSIPAIDTQECDLVAKAVVDGKERGFLMMPDGRYMDSRGDLVPDNLLRSAVRFGRISPLTFTCVYPGGGRRIALDRDLDGVLDDDPAAPAPLVTGLTGP